jgi:hypothetical protein
MKTFKFLLLFHSPFFYLIDVFLYTSFGGCVQLEMGFFPLEPVQ